MGDISNSGSSSSSSSGNRNDVVLRPYMKEEFNIFTPPKVDTSARNGSFVDLHPIANVSGDQPVEFYDPGTSDQFTDLTQTQLRITGTIVKADGSALGADDNVATINNALHACFSRSAVQFNDVDVTSSTAHYSYRAYIQTLLNSSLEEKNSHLTGQGYYVDDNLTSPGPNPPDVVTPNPDEPAAPIRTPRPKNKGLQLRFADLSNGTFQYSGPVECDVFNIEKYLIPGVSIRLKLTRSNERFALMCGGEDPDYKILINEARLRLFKITATPNLRGAIEDCLARRLGVYYFTRSDIKTMTIEKGALSFNQDNMFPGALPKRLTFGLVASTAFAGSYSENPFYFHHYNLSRVSIEIDGRPVPYNAIKTDFSSNAYLDAYSTLVTGGTDAGNGISMEEYKQGFMLICLDLTPDKGAGAGDYLQPEVRGNLSIELNFREELDHQVTLVALPEGVGCIKIDANRNVVATHAD